MRKLTLRGNLLTAAVCGMGILVMGYVLTLIHGQNTPYIDATTNVLSIVATFLMIWRYREQWLLYITLNVFTILMWAIRLLNGSPDGILMIVMWIAYLVNACYGFWNWSKGTNTLESK